METRCKNCRGTLLLVKPLGIHSYRGQQLKQQPITWKHVWHCLTGCEKTEPEKSATGVGAPEQKLQPELTHKKLLPEIPPQAKAYGFLSVNQ